MFCNKGEMLNAVLNEWTSDVDVDELMTFYSNNSTNQKEAKNK